MVPRSMPRFRFSQDSTALRSAIFLSSSSVDRLEPVIPGTPAPGTFMPPQRFFTNSSVSVIPAAFGMGGLSIVVLRVVERLA